MNSKNRYTAKVIFYAGPGTDQIAALREFNQHINEAIMSTIIIGGGGKAAIQKLIDTYPRMTPDQKAEAARIERAFVEAADELLANVSED